MPTAHAPTPSPPRLGDWPLSAVLVVDDEPGMRSFLEKALASRCGAVHAARDTREAAALMQRHRFDLVILDITLPGQSGC